MGKRTPWRQIAERVLFFFPFQLLVLHFKKNHVMLLCWLLLFGYVLQGIGLKYGIPYLFLYPEYFGAANAWSFLLLGFALGGFITAFNLFSYTLHAFRFPFVATLARPFLKFNLNNAIIPAVFVLTYLWASARLQYYKELVPAWDVVVHLAAFLAGIGSFLLIALLYFTRTNTDVHKLEKTAGPIADVPPMEDIIPQVPPVRQQQRKASRWLRREQRTKKWRVETYLTWPPQLKLARGIKHYDNELLRRVLWQNHINANIFELAVVITFIALGAFSDAPFFAIPAGASIFLFFTMVLMLYSAVSSWVKGWMATTIFASLVLLNAISMKTQGFLYDTQAYGLDYTAPPARYDLPTIHHLATDSTAAAKDEQAHLQTLERWLAKNKALPHPGGKPPMVIINVSGGGSRAMLWTFRCLQVADSLLGGNLMDRTVLIAGSSGGLIGATYYRQLVLGEKLGGTDRASDPRHLDQISSDILNPVAFSLVTSDMFIRYRKVIDGERSYTLDRGYAFELRLDSLTGGLLNVRLKDMAEHERKAEVPLLVVSPTILNDGRRLLISSMSLAHLSAIGPHAPVHSAVEPESIEFQKLFKDQDPMNLKLSSALRMSASFPYITPVTSLPSEPRMCVMDAGGRDNYGYRTTLSFLRTYRAWLAENVDRVVMIQVRDKQRQLEVKPVNGSMLGRLAEPVGSVYDNFIRIQDQDFDLALKTAEAWMTVPLDVLDLQLWMKDDAEISLSWHLTAVEKKMVLATIDEAGNQEAFSRLQNLLVGPDPLKAAAVRGTAAAR